MKPNVPYHLARLEGKIVRWLYQLALPRIARRKIDIPREMPFEVYAYSGESTLPEQVASIRSFLINAGRPRQFTVVSDGSHTEKSIVLLESIDRCIRVQTCAPPLPPGLPDQVQSYLTGHFTGKQLALIMSLPNNGPTLYADSDVLFFPEARRLADLSRTPSVSALYLRDYQLSADPRLIHNAADAEKPVNMGFLLLFRKLDWSIGVRRLEKLPGTPNFFTTQAVVHLCMHSNDAVEFDPQTFVLEATDEFVYRDQYAATSIAIRHYVNPIRHKFWAALGHQMLRGSL